MDQEKKWIQIKVFAVNTSSHHLDTRVCVCVCVCVTLRAMNPKHQHQRGKMLNNDNALIAV